MQHIIDVQSPFRFALTFRHISGEHTKNKKDKGKGTKRKADDDDDDDDDEEDYDEEDAGGKRRKLDIETRNGRAFVAGTNQPARRTYDEQLDTDDMDTPGASTLDDTRDSEMTDS